MKTTIVIGAVFLLFAIEAIADVPSTFSYQGILTDSLGQPVEDDIYAIQFRIYEDSVTTTPVWESNGFIPKQTSNGLFSHILGSTNPLPESLSRYFNLWIGITVDLDNEMTPRTKLTSVPSALSAQFADTAKFVLNKTNAGMVRVEDTTFVSVSIPGGSGWILLKSINIEPTEISDFFRTTFPIYVDPYATIEVLANTQLLYSYTHDTTPRIVSINSIRYNSNNWMSQVVYGTWSYENSFDLTGGLTIEIYGSWGVNAVANIGNLIVEYDVD